MRGIREFDFHILVKGAARLELGERRGGKEGGEARDDASFFVPALSPSFAQEERPRSFD